MSQSTNRYDRDHNIDGPVFPFTFVPEYGSKVSFENKNVHFNTADNYYKKFSKGVNGTNLKFNLKFSNKTEDEARSFLHFIEETLASSGGDFNFNTTGSSGVEIAFPTGSIYKNIDELLIQNYDFKFHNGLFDIDLNLLKNGYSSLFNWSGSSYLNTANFYPEWETGIDYKEFDVIYYSGYAEQNSDYFETGNYYRIADRRENFYYCNSGHASESGNSPTGSGSAWSRSFFYEIDDDISIGSDRSINIFELKDSFSSFIKQDQNGGLIKDLSLSLKNRSDKEVRSIMHFIEKHEDYRPLELTLPQLYNKKKFFVIKSLDHKFVYKDCNDLDLTLDEIFLFKKPDLFDNYRTISTNTEFSMNVVTTQNNQPIQISGENESGNDIRIGWGDGQISTITGYNDPEMTHVYATTGNYNIRVSGYIPNIRLPILDHKRKVTSVNQLGVVGWDDLSEVFYGWNSMTSFTAGNTDTSLVTNMDEMFRDCYDLVSLDMDGLDSSSVTGMQNMFRNCQVLDGPNIDFSKLDTSSSVDMNWMFSGCRRVVNMDLSSFDTSSVTGMRAMFDFCDINLTGLNVSNFDTSSVVDMSNMFADCQNLISIDLSSFNTPSVTTMNNMFSNCRDLTGIDLSSFGSSAVTDMYRMFFQCYAAKNIDLSNFNTYAATGAKGMFYACQDLTGTNFSGFNTSSVTDMSEMFKFCSDLTGLDLSDFDTSSVTTMREMFRNCTRIRNLDFPSFDTSSVVDMSQMFYSMGLSKSIDVSSFDGSSVVDLSKMFGICYDLTGINLSGFNTPSATDMSEMFASCNDLTGLDVSDFDTSSVTNMYKMFGFVRSLTSLDLSSFDTSSVSDMSQMFNGCDRLTGLDLSSFDASSLLSASSMFSSCNDLTGVNISNFNAPLLTDTSNMFNECTSLTGINLSGFDAPLVTDQRFMFRNCITLPSLDLSSFSGSSATSTYQMFQNCYNLTSLDVSNFNTSSVTNMYQMFEDCNSLTGLDLSNFDTSSVSNMQQMFDDCGSLSDIIGVDQFNIEAINSTSLLTYFCRGVTLPTPRYDSLLIAWDAQSVKSSMTNVHFGGSLYTAGGAAEAARTNLDTVDLWTIIDGGPA
jgi:surface protein